MKQYRFINFVELNNVQSLINEYAAQGWEVNTFNIIGEGEHNQDKWAYILFEADVEE